MRFTNLIIYIHIFLFSNSCFSQQLVRNITDVQRIKANEKLFLGKPMKILLKEIKPQIKRVTARPSKSTQTAVGFFLFNFVDSKQKDSLRLKEKIPVTLVVYVKENFDWDFQKRPKGKEMVWTKEDAKKYENLTIVGFRVYGEGSASN